MARSYSTALSHAILGGAGIYSLFQIKDQTVHCPHATFAIITLASVVGVCKWGSADSSKRLEQLFKYTSYIQLLFALPCITTTVWLDNGYNENLSWLWTLVAIFPFLYYIKDADMDETVDEILTAAHVMALLVVSFLANNYYGIASAISYALGHFCIKHGDYFHIPAQTCCNYSLCFFVYFALKAIENKN